MWFRTSVSLLFLAAVAGCAPSDSPTGLTAPESPRFAAGLKPPPPLGSEETSITIDVSGGCEFTCGDFAALNGPSAGAAFADFTGFHGFTRGRYLANTQSTNGWIQFVSSNNVTASTNARLSYDEMTGRTNGVGTLTDQDENVLDLSLIQITPPSHFGTCALNEYCADITFVYAGVYPGTISVYHGSEPPIFQ